jgi:hypothetical protein
MDSEAIESPVANLPLNTRKLSLTGHSAVN